MSCVPAPMVHKPMMEGGRRYKVLVMGDNIVGKTSIIKQILGEQFSGRHKATIQDMYKRNFMMGDTNILLEIEDTSGLFAFDFPAMVELSLKTVDAVLLVFSVTDKNSYEQLGLLRDIVMQFSCPDMPIVIAGNKCDMDNERKVKRKEAEELIIDDWDNVYMECSAKMNENISQIFQQLISLASNHCLDSSNPLVAVPLGKKKMDRRKSFSVALLQPHMSLSLSPIKNMRRKSKSLQYEPGELQDVMEKTSTNSSRRESMIPNLAKLMKKTCLSKTRAESKDLN